MQTQQLFRKSVYFENSIILKLKTMKNYVFAILALWGAQLFAQQNYLQISAGYGLGYPGEEGSSFDLGFASATAQTEHIPLGGGISAAVAYGVPLSAHLDVEFGLAYQNNLGQEISNVLTPFPAAGAAGFAFGDVTVKSSSLQFRPLFRMDNGNDGAFTPFMKIGPTLNYAMMKTEEESVDLFGGFFGGDDSTTLQTVEYRGALGFGFLAALGVELPLSD